MKVGKEGLNLIKAFEGCLRPIGGGRYKAYICPAGVLTIGWGHTNHHGRRFNSSSVWTQAEVDAELVSDLAGFEQAVLRRVKVPLTQYQFDALVSFAYNCGEGNLAKSTLLKKVNRKDFKGAAQEFKKWNKGAGRVLPGLVRRRASESLLFQGIPDRNYDGRPDANPQRLPLYGLMPQQVDLIDSENLAGALKDVLPTLPTGELKKLSAGASVALSGGGLGALLLSQIDPSWWYIAGGVLLAILGGVAYTIWRVRSK